MIATASEFKILVIEDNSGDFVLIEDYLSESFKNPTVLRGTNFAKVKELIHQNPDADIIILDLTLPDLSGEELIVEVLSINLQNPIIVLTGSRNKNGAKLLSTGISDYLLKDELTAALLHKSITYSIERGKTLKKLRESEEKYKSIFELSPLPKWIYDKETFEFLYVNQAAVRHYGYSLEEFMSMTIHDIRPKKEVQKLKVALRNIKNNNAYANGTFRHRKKNGEIIDVQVESNEIDFEGRPARLVLSIDVTARVENERMISESNERFEAIARATSDAIYDYDFETKKIYISGSSYHTLFGYQFENQITDIDFFKTCLHPDDRDRVYDFLNSTVEDPKSTHFEIEYKLLKSDGNYADILDRFNILWSNGKPIKKVGAMQDISTRKFQETILAFEKEIYELNANPKISFDFVINKLVTNIEMLIPDSYCTIISLSEDLKLDVIANGSMEPEYVQSLAGVEIGPAVGSCGTAMYRGKSVFVSDIENDPLWKDYKHLAQPYGYKACWSVPVKKRTGKVIASFATHYKKIKSPNEEEISLINRVTNLIGVLLENRNSFEETERAKERYDIVAKATSDTIWDWKIQEDDFLWNKGIQGVFGYKKEDVGKTSKWWFDRVHPEDSIRVSVKLYNFLEEKVEKWQDEYRFACADGSYKYVFDRGFLVKDGDGKPIRMIGAMQDVTRQKEEEQRLKLLETVVTQTKDSVIISEAEKASSSGIPKIVFVNPAFTQMTGFKPSEVIGKAPSIFMGKKSVANQITKLSEALKNKKEFKF